MSPLSRIFTASLLLAAAATAHAASPQAVIDDFARDLKGLEGHFSQRVLDADGQEIERSSGTVAVAVPRQFRWEYVEPFPQLIVADGQHVYIYDPDLEQVTVRRQSDEEQASPLAALIEPGALERQFVVEFGPAHDGMQPVTLKPRGEATTFEVCELLLTGTTLERMTMTDSLDQRTEITFSDWQRNPAFAAGTFRFVPPDGVDVVGDVEPGAETFPAGE